VADVERPVAFGRFGELGFAAEVGTIVGTGVFEMFVHLFTCGLSGQRQAHGQGGDKEECFFHRGKIVLFSLCYGEHHDTL
jgi:hypothetical protein